MFKNVTIKISINFGNNSSFLIFQKIKKKTQQNKLKILMTEQRIFSFHH